MDDHERSIVYHPAAVERGVGRGDLSGSLLILNPPSIDQFTTEHHETGKIKPMSTSTQSVQEFHPKIQPTHLRSSEFHKRTSGNDSSHSDLQYPRPDEFPLRSAQDIGQTEPHLNTKVSSTALPEVILSRPASVQSNIAYCTEDLDKPYGYDFADTVISHDAIARKLQLERDPTLFKGSRSENQPSGSLRSADRNNNDSPASGIKEKRSIARYWRRFTDTLRGRASRMNV